MIDKSNKIVNTFIVSRNSGIFSGLVIGLLVIFLIFSAGLDTAVGEDKTEEISNLDNLEINNLEQLDLEEVIEELMHIRRIDSDLSRLMAYDDFVDDLRERIELVEKRTRGIVAEYKGEDDKVTDLYEIEAPWEINWASTGRIFQLYVYDEDDRRVDVAANKTRGGHGIYENNSSGRYYLEIRAVGKWNLTIKEAVDE